MRIEALGKDFPLAYTVEAQAEMAEKAGGIEQLNTLFDADDAAKSFENTLWVLSVMMNAYANRERLKATMMGKKWDGMEPPTLEQLRVLLDVTEINKDIMGEITAAMKVGNKTSVEVKSEKNGKATR